MVATTVTVAGSACLAVSSKLVRHSTQADFLKGQTENVVIDSRGNLQLGRSWQQLAGPLEHAWAVNTIVVQNGRVFLGTSPNGLIYQYYDGKLSRLYPPQPSPDQPANPPDAPPEPNAVQPDRPKRHLTNEHIFAMTPDQSGRLLAAVSGGKCRLIRFSCQPAEPETLFEPNDARYIFAVCLDKAGNIYLGTGPEGKLYRLDPAGKNPQLVYDVEDKSIMSLAVGKDEFIYAGTDGRALVYRINPQAAAGAILYDTDEAEVAALAFDKQGSLYAAATSTQAMKRQAKTAPVVSGAQPGRPETETPKADSSTDIQSLKLKIPNTAPKAAAGKADKAAAQPPRGIIPAPGASHIYKITGQGFVTDVFQQPVVFYALAQQDQQLLVATGNTAQLFALEPESEQQAVAYEDKQASQISALAVVGDDVYVGTANPAKLIKLAKTLAREGTYSSELVDAGQPAQWGKLHLEADIPPDCAVLVSARSGNVKDVNDPTFSPWTEPIQATEPVQLFCPLGRFCQYRLTLKPANAQQGPLIREVAIAHSVPNLAPQVEAVTVERLQTPDKQGRFKITCKAKDDNNDKLIYKIEFRKVGRTGWIELKDQLEADSFEWDGRTVEDGRYEVRVTASDERDNTPATSLSGVRISEPVIVDNTPPIVELAAVQPEGKTTKLVLRVTDQLSAIGKVSYTVDGNEKWKGALPQDLIYDTTSEDLTIVVEDLCPGQHVIAIKVEDAAENTLYKTFDVTIEQK
jgi:hypothetical protein